MYKIDVPRALIYVKGSVPGKPGTYSYLKDSIKKKYVNLEYLNFPTFIPIPGEEYAQEIMMKPRASDPFEEYLHDNAVVDYE